MRRLPCHHLNRRRKQSRKNMEEFYPKTHRSYPRDHERAYFDSADRALDAMRPLAYKPKGPLESLPPKLQPTPQQQVHFPSHSLCIL
ncbi:hypothetical protein GW17_00008795 [Ensete ventricosum]|nr:hypothetical protein GW17_00008795 [Ensete ventricosum]